MRSYDLTEKALARIAGIRFSGPWLLEMSKLYKKLFNFGKNRPWAENVTIVMQIGLTMAGCICFCFFIGLQIDRWLGVKGIFVTVFILLGIAGGANVVYRQIMDIMEPKK